MKTLIDKHQTCIEILEAIQYFKIRKITTDKSLNGFAGTFQNLRRKYEHDFIIYDMCIERLKQRYVKILLMINLK